MKDLISKATFGFVMAQLFPGAIAVFAIGFAYFTFEGNQPATVLRAAGRVLRVWSDATIAEQLFLVALCVGAGMLIHGINWAVLGALENALGGSIFDSKFHQLRIVWQILLGPLRVAFEVAYLLFKPKQVRSVRMQENVPYLKKDAIEQFQWLEDFYLYSAQFFAHISFAFIICVLALIEFVVINGLTLRRVTLFVILYVLIGVCFMLGRIQFASLFYAEEMLVRPGTDQTRAADRGEEDDED